MNAFHEVEPFPLLPLVGRTPFVDQDAARAEEELLRRLEELPAGGLLPVDFSGVRIASAAARRLLRRALLRLTGGELPDRYLVLDELGESQYSVDTMLVGEDLLAVERTPDGPELRGDVDPAVAATYAFLAGRETATASLLQEQLQLGNISTATNRLTNLAKLGLARRVEHRPAAGGGREYVYAAVR